MAAFDVLFIRAWEMKGIRKLLSPVVLRADEKAIERQERLSLAIFNGIEAPQQTVNKQCSLKSQEYKIISCWLHHVECDKLVASFLFCRGKTFTFEHRPKCVVIHFGMTRIPLQ